jgi:cytochrome c556
MNRFLGLAVALGLVLSVAVVAAEDKGKEDDVPTIKAVMKAAHGKKGLLSKTQADVKKKDFDALATDSKDLVKLADALTKNMPKKGEKESWEKLSGDYLKAAKELSTAAEKKDLDVAVASLTTLSKSCGVCHKAHK